MRFTFEWNGTKFLKVTTEAALERGVPQSVLDDVILAARKSSVALECRHRIYAVASAEAQMNMASSAAVISGKAASNRAEDEKATLAGAASLSAWISAMRAAYADLAQDSEADFRADAAWPEAPEDLVTLVARF